MSDRDQSGCRNAVERLEASAHGLGIELSPAQVDLFARYCCLIVETSRKMNVTALRTPDQVATGLFLDSLALAAALPESVRFHTELSLVDVGSGAGIPGLPLRILHPGWHVTLVESIGKKASFLTDLSSVLGLTDVCILHERAEQLGRDEQWREVFQLCVARAVAPLATLLELCVPLVRPGGILAFAKGPDWEAEAQEAGSAASLLGVAQPRAIRLPTRVGYGPRVVVMYDKISPTPRRFPRRPGMPRTHPLGAKSRGRGESRERQERAKSQLPPDPESE